MAVLCLGGFGYGVRRGVVLEGGVLELLNTVTSRLDKKKWAQRGGQNHSSGRAPLQLTFSKQALLQRRYTL